MFFQLASLGFVAVALFWLAAVTRGGAPAAALAAAYFVPAPSGRASRRLIRRFAAG